jgi:hypothetical protein
MPDGSKKIILEYTVDCGGPNSALIFCGLVRNDSKSDSEWGYVKFGATTEGRNF